jgi:hypothetical protein
MEGVCITICKCQYNAQIGGEWRRKKREREIATGFQY